MARNLTPADRDRFNERFLENPSGPSALDSQDFEEKLANPNYFFATDDGAGTVAWVEIVDRDFGGRRVQDIHIPAWMWRGPEGRAPTKEEGRAALWPSLHRALGRILAARPETRSWRIYGDIPGADQDDARARAFFVETLFDVADVRSSPHPENPHYWQRLSSTAGDIYDELDGYVTARIRGR